MAESEASNLTWQSLFTDPSLFARLWRAALLQFMAQMCGATAMKYYLPTLFKVLGLGTRLSLLAGGIESTLKIGCTVLEMLIIDRVGRRITMAVGAGVMAFAMLVSGESAREESWFGLVLPLMIRHRLTACCPSRTRTTLTTPRTMLVLFLSLSTPLDTVWALDPRRGCTVLR